MRITFLGGFVLVLAFAGAPATSVAADEYAIDGMHASVYFRISHIGLSWVYGRFDEFSGNFTIDADDPTKCSFQMNIKASSIDTNNRKRDDHLRSPDFFNVKQ